MNRLELLSEDRILNDFNDKIKLIFDKDRFTININENIKGPIIFNNRVEADIIFNIGDNINITILEIKTDTNKRKDRYQYILGHKSKLFINKFYSLNEYKEKIIIDLNGINSEVLFNLSVMSLGKEEYDIIVNHNHQETISNIINHGVTFNDGIIDMIVDGKIKKGMRNSILNQDNKIMIMGNGKSSIKPNLYIDEYEVEARHGASIGKFNEEEIFYLESRGIPETEGYNLLIEGFLLGNINLDEQMRLELSNIIKNVRR